MRHARRNGQRGVEFGSSGEDSFVAVVVTKLTGALLFILLLTMVIMALIPRAVDRQAQRDEGREAAEKPLEITTPSILPDAIAGRSYAMALAATGGHGERRWSITGTVPKGLHLDESTGVLSGAPESATSNSVPLTITVQDDHGRASRVTTLAVLQPHSALAPRRLPPSGHAHVPFRSWLDQGFGFVVLILVHIVGMQTLSRLEQGSPDQGETKHRRYRSYRTAVRLTTLAAVVALFAWLFLTPLS